ncbi:MAG: oligosaccharide flippase family protein [Eubacteriales bacterium]|nr:oligosaccharide flippase family protein [Eubacteriales bacterium]
MHLNQKKVGVLLSYSGQIIKILLSLIYTPIMLRLLGQSEYGLYQLVYSVVSYLGLLSLGFGNSYMRFFSRFTAQKDHDGVARLNGMFLFIFSALSIICVLCGFVMIQNIEKIFGDGLTSIEMNKAKKLMGLMVINLAITFPNSVFASSITAHEKFLFQKLVILLQNIFNPLLALPLLLMGYGSVGMVTITTFLTFFVLILNIYYCFNKLQIRFIFKNIPLGLLKEMWVFTFFIFFNQIIDQINWSVDKFLLGRFVGTSVVAVYGVGGQINSMYLEFSTSISNVFIPEVNRLVAESTDNIRLTNLLTKVGRIQFMVLSLVLTGFIFLGKPFITMWAGAGYTESYVITLLLITPVTVALIQNIGIEIQRAKNMHKARSIVYFFIAIGNVFISIPFIKILGATGAAIGTAISLVVGNIFFMNWYYHKRIGLNVFYFWKQIASFIPSLIMPCVVGVLMMKYITINSLTGLALCIMLYSIIYSISIYFWGMNAEEKQMINMPFKKLLKK